MGSGFVWPRPDERRLLSRFYVAVGLSRALYLVYPFEFAYLYLAMDRPEWSVIPLIVASGTELVAQLPTGVIADRWGRKVTVLAGGTLSGAAFVVVPWTVRLPGGWQLAGTCAAFGLVGLGQTMMSGAQEAWVVDNLHDAGRADLIDTFFARIYAVTSLGSVVASGAALAILMLVPVDRGLLDLLWYATAAGFACAVLVAMRIREHRPELDPGREGNAFWQRTKESFTILVRARVLLFLTIAVVIASLSAAGADEAFPVSLLTKGLDARMLGPLGIADGLIGVAAPLLGLFLARRLGAEPLLSVVLVLAAAAASTLLATQAIWLVLVLYVVLGMLDQMWDPVALARLQYEIPSDHRAAIGSIVYEADGLAELAGLGLFALVLGSHSQQLRDATPDLVQAFSGHSHVTAQVPSGLFGIPVPDVAIVAFVLLGLLAVPFLVLTGRARTRGAMSTRRGEGPPEPPAPTEAGAPASHVARKGGVPSAGGMDRSTLA